MGPSQKRQQVRDMEYRVDMDVSPVGMPSSDPSSRPLLGLHKAAQHSEDAQDKPLVTADTGSAQVGVMKSGRCHPRALQDPGWQALRNHARASSQLARPQGLWKHEGGSEGQAAGPQGAL